MVAVDGDSPRWEGDFGARGAGPPRIIAWANYMALAPDHRDVWVEQAGPPWDNGPADSPAWLAGEDGRRLSGVRATLPAVLGAFPAGSSDVVCARWSADGSGLWIVATDGLFFQAAYWTGHGPLRVLRPQVGLAHKFDIPGSVR